jgi:hypothetical protein
MHFILYTWELPLGFHHGQVQEEITISLLHFVLEAFV